MFKRFTTAIFLLALMCGASWGASSTTEIDPFNIQFWYVNPDYEKDVYNRYGNGYYNFFYQLRDVTGAGRSEKVGGPQWFATVYENYYYAVRRALGDTTASGDIYRRTMGGEIPDITVMTVGDMLDGFNFVFAEEPEPYATSWRRYISRQVYDVYPDPLESLCLVITNGTGEFNIEFGNPYARDFPFWWNFRGTAATSSTTKWWLQTFDWRNETYPTAEPIAYIYSSPDLYVRNNSTGKYEKGYKFTVSRDYSSDKTTVIATHLQLRDMSGISQYTISGDKIYTSRDALAYTVSASTDKVYDASNTLVYTIETDAAGDMFICEIRNIYESITFEGFGSDYTLSINPTGEQTVPSGSALNGRVYVRGIAPSDYGSKLGYITFRQRANFAPGYSNYREYSSIPFVIANVANGNASLYPLMFDMTVYSNDVPVNRIKFTWDAQSDKPDQDLGTFFMIGSRDAQYQLETRITNRTGTRYELYRYDMTGSQEGNPANRDGYASIMPDHWKYDLTPDLYGTLPDYFRLDAQSQIAPGLVTVYKNNIGSGYRTINTVNDTTESFRLNEYSSAAPKNLRLNYKRVGGMRPIENGIHSPESGVRVQEFSMAFADVAANSDNTAAELLRLTGKYPSMILTGPLVSNPDTSVISSKSSISSSAAGNNEVAEVKTVYINSSAIDAFSFTKIVPEQTENQTEMIRKKSEDIPSPEDSGDQYPETPESGDTSGVSFSASTVKWMSIDIGLQPVSIRMRVPRQSQLIVNHWDELDGASNSSEVFRIFSQYGSVWVRSEATAEKDANLFTAVNNKGSNIGVSAADCIRAFTYDNELYLDFIVLLADGKSVNSGMTAYVEVFKDDGVPYVLIGDGNENAKWEMTFYVAPAGENPTIPTDDNKSTVVDSGDKGVPQANSSSGGGGGCNVSGVMAAMVLGVLLRKKK